MERVIASNLYDSGFDKQNALEPAVEANQFTGNQHLFDEVEGMLGVLTLWSIKRPVAIRCNYLTIDKW